MRLSAPVHGAPPLPHRPPEREAGPGPLLSRIVCCYAILDRSDRVPRAYRAHPFNLLRHSSVPMQSEVAYMTTVARPESPFASTLPGRYYYDPAVYALEAERIFTAMWVCIGRADALDGPGAYQVAMVGQESVIVVRGRDGILRAFLNVCRHRGTRLCAAAAGHLKGSIQCRYHAWTYGLDGQLIGAPNVLNEEQLDRAAFGLVSV